MTLTAQVQRFESLIEGVTVATIGPITASTARELGFKVDIEPQDYTIPGLCDAILEHYASKNARQI